MRPLALIVLDGWGLSECDDPNSNAISRAKKPNFDSIWNKYPHANLKASGENVGLPDGQMGNSEVGHLNIGAGRVVYQELTRINKAVREKTLASNPVLKEALEKCKNENKPLHLLGLLSDGGVHSHIQHLFALLDIASEMGINDIFIHAFLDGRDVSPTSSITYIEQLEDKLQELGRGKIATIMGRYYAMDRDNRWDRVELAYKAMVLGEGDKAPLAKSAIEQSYDKKIIDEFIKPTVIVDQKGESIAQIKQDDVVVFYNFRADRAREISRVFVDKDFTYFKRSESCTNIHYVCMTQYDKDIKAPVIFSPQNLKNTLGEVLSAEGIKQLRIAETEKYAHVTFFFNGGVEDPNPGEERVLIPSPKVATYNLQPEMSAELVTQKLIEEINTEKYGFILLNFANPDMVGHTGDIEATVKAIETVDNCLGKVLTAMEKVKGKILITADHGNAESMFDPETGKPITAHTCNLVPFILVAEELKSIKLKETGSLQDIAPTVLNLLNIEKPAEMTGNSLVNN
ncbi:phosphoglycerate mutase [Desulfonispora thiosulfatigenes DSM 11270]|uniref:2,3-bisphosphoglycerate-independent phosphoglycerate mutase n=1 Tax=Desulfonispora thiosulfatigenes DSM 11270 TaxID=656914 RepID=A0A1W1UWL6_DESTI|nr:2,3-bisphosphoglycerate-independent phosphoglycerate mutase [Desulfonispora thiosulfatigenes]SMB85389.1 phosphoglycerate mutase [Desulfonispora thiosulfatigenes DSM 11270]